MRLERPNLALGAGMAMILLDDLKRRILGLPKADCMNLPTEQEINPEGNSHDGQVAVAHFLGKTPEQITKELATRLHWYFYEDYLWMGSRAFCFYFPAVADYVTTAKARTDYQVVDNFCRVIESRLNSDSAQIRDAVPAILRFAEYVLAHFEEYEEDEELRERLRAVKQRCAEPVAQSNGGPARPASNSAITEKPPTAG